MVIRAPFKEMRPTILQCLVEHWLSLNRSLQSKQQPVDLSVSTEGVSLPFPLPLRPMRTQTKELTPALQRAKRITELALTENVRGDGEENAE